MQPSSFPWPLDHPDYLTDALREQDAAPEEIAELLPALCRLSEWQAPQPSPADTQRLIARLIPQMPEFSAVRQAIRAEQQRQGASISRLLKTARTQVSLFGLDFWLASAFATLLGTAVLLSADLPTQEYLMRAIGPFLAYLGTIAAFRGIGARVLELELTCLPSLLQLAVARLVIVLGYDLGLGLALGLALWAGGAGQVLALTLSWFMPLLLVAGLALLLSLRLSVKTAAALAYGGWLAILAIDTLSPLPALPLTPLAEVLLGGLGLALLAIALLRLRIDMHRLLPRA
ncbi:MAG TPA: hypothetical protein VKT82_08355 [Ktedonobacterales bacterium]|nr:hypothetical protein [Ktedonobacterales bacterium]